MLGIFLTLLFTARFIIELFKEVQVDFEKAMTLDMGQLLSIPGILIGIYLIVWSVRNRK
jgi:prolipoprotein diacylglyceryltransferase